MASNNASVAAMLRIASSYCWRIARGSAGSLGFHEGAGSCAGALGGSTVARSGALGREIHIMRAKTITGRLELDNVGAVVLRAIDHDSVLAGGGHHSRPLSRSRSR